MKMPPCKLDERDRALVSVIQKGLPLVSHPFAEIGRRIGMPEHEVLQRLERLNMTGAIKRFGVVVRHRELGYRANAMVVWDVPETQIREIGQCLGRYHFVTLCYRRPRRLPDWPYNLFTMIHGQSREAVIDKVNLIIEQCDLHDIPHELLFSKRRFKQCGAQYCASVPRTDAKEATPA